MGTATGTSMGTIGAIVPIAVGVADKGGLSVPLVVGACVGGAMFGDNLSMISDTTIAATKTQGVALKDKFRVNFYIALPAAILTLVILLIVGRSDAAVLTAVNITDELFKAQAAAEQLRGQIKGYLDEAGKAQAEVSELKREVFRLQQRLDNRNKG